MKKLLFILLIAVTGCQQKLPPPEVDFTSVDDGKGFIQFTTTSMNATSYAWDFGDKGATSKEKNANHAYSANGIYQVKLDATGPWGTTTVTRPVSVTGVRGSIMFWMPKGSNSVEVFVRDVRIGSVFNFFPNGVTYCGTVGCALANNLPEGDHPFTARETGSTEIKWSGVVSVVGGQCIKKALTY
ncbi:PKD domain-containing protein [Spirosoma linguale]|uniref:PKD domain containing protein n=1 Tax=Spirosoma linguale (strain ATCC 33905 / DSM 74 / LMG 10896 / Claus 1) TaxID=504472 RepID=D2QHP7_SPILD|nr:PKD domain containing protein [Spirosoma linguale DSM 74]